MVLVFCMGFASSRLRARVIMVHMFRRSFFSSCVLLFHLQHVRALPSKTCIGFMPVGSRLILHHSGDAPRVICRFKELCSQASEDDIDEKLNQILLAMEKSPRSWRKICHNYVDILCKTGNLCAAVRLMQALHGRNILLGLNTYDALLAVAAAKSEFDVLYHVFKDMVLCFESLPSASYLALAKAFVKTNDHFLLLRLVKEVSELPLPRSTMVTNRLIFAFGECGQFDKALVIFDQMKDLKCKPDLVTYNTVFDLLGRSCQIEKMLSEFNSMKENGIRPDFISYNTLLNQLRKVGRLDLCLVYFKEMSDNGIEADLLTYTALIRSFCQSGNIEEALRLFDEMKMRQIRPSIYIYRSLIDGLKKMKELDLAAVFVNEMNASISDLAGPDDFKRRGR